MNEPTSPPWVVIGGGAAGVMAATALAECGKSAIILAEGPGASGFFSGSVDTAGDPDRQPGRGHKSNRNVRTNLIRQIHQNPQHPLRMLAADEGDLREEVLMERLDEAMNFFRSQMAFVGYGLEGQAMSRQRGTLTAIGSIKETNLLHAPHARFFIDDLHGASLAIVGFEGMADHSAEDAARVLRHRCRNRLPKEIQIHTANIRIAPPESGPTVSTYQVARFLETAEGAQRLMEGLDKALWGKGYTHIYLPPAMGMTSHEYHLTKIAEALDASTCEMLGVHAPVPGRRFYEALGRLLDYHDIETIHGKAVGFESDHNRISAIKLDDRTLETSGVVLASGKFFAGGIVRDREFIEPVFDLPVFSGSTPIRRHTNPELTRPNPLRRQPLFEAGIQVNDRFQPLDTSAKICWQNLYAAGSVLTGTDYLVDHCGMGMAVSTGYHAARKAAFD